MMLHLFLALILLYFSYINFKNFFNLILFFDKWIAMLCSIVLFLISMYCIYNGVIVIVNYIIYLWSIK